MLKIELRTPRNRILNGWRVLAKDPVGTLERLGDCFATLCCTSFGTLHFNFNTPSLARKPGTGKPKPSFLQPEP